MKKVKSIIAIVLTFFFSISLFFINNSTVKAEDTTKLIIHYYRLDENYNGWNLWIWNAEAGGKDLNPAPPYEFNGEDSYGKTATINLNVKTSKVGMIVRKGNWEDKDISKDRFIENINGTKEVWLMQGEETIFDKAPAKTPKMNAFIDDKNVINVKLAKPITFTGKNLESFKVLENGMEETPVEIKSVENAKPQPTASQLSMKPYQRGYELIDSGKKIKFILKSGNFTFTDETGKLDVYVSGTMNDWGGTSGPKSTYEPLNDWKMNWNDTEKQYELIKNIGSTNDDVSIGSKFKFTTYDGTNASWFPGGSGNDNLVEQLASSDANSNETDLIKITLKDNLDVTGYYEVARDGYKNAGVAVRNVLGTNDYVYTKNDLGVTYNAKSYANGAKASTFKLWAPTAAEVNVLIYNDEKTEKYKRVPMKLGSKGVWYSYVKGNLDGKYYLYEVSLLVNGIPKIYTVADPYSFGSSANSGRSLIYDRNKVNSAVQGWDKDKYVSLANNVDSVLYEMHVRDFSVDASSGVNPEYQGKYLAFTQTGTKTKGGNSTGIDHLKELGITHIHLLPTYDYGTGDENNIKSTYNWGYDPVLYNNVEGMYATNPNGTSRQIEYKKMVKALHDANIGVVTDVVFNHTLAVGDNDKSIFDKIVPGYYYRVDDTGNYSNGSGCGNEVASERPMVRKFILDSVKYWLKEYHIDGLRFDLMALLDKDTIAQVYKEAKAINPNVIIYGEGWTGGASTLSPDLKMEKNNLKAANLNVAMFNDEIREDVKGNNDGDVKGFAQGGGFRNGKDRLEKEIKGLSDFVSNPNQTINYVSAHDNLCLWDKISKSNPDDSIQTRTKMSNLANAIILTSQGVPFIQGGSEFARTKSSSSNPANTYNDVKGNDIDWNLKDTNLQMVSYYKGLIELRKAHPAFRMTDAKMINANITFAETAGNTIQYTIADNANKDSWKKIMVIINGEAEAKEFSADGAWSIVVNDQASGTRTLSKASDRITVPAYSMIVAYQE